MVIAHVIFSVIITAVLPFYQRSAKTYSLDLFFCFYQDSIFVIVVLLSLLIAEPDPSLNH